MTNHEQNPSDLLEDEETRLSELGDYLSQLEAYEERLARGEIQWK